LVAVPGFALLLLIFWSFGDRMMRLLGLRTESAVERFAFSTTLSLSAVTLSIFALAVTRQVTWVSCLILAGGMAAVSFRELRSNLGTLKTSISSVPWKRVVWPGGDWQAWAAWLSGLIVALGAVQALAPVTGMDTGKFHFAAVKLMVRAHGLLPAPDDWYHRTGGYYMVYLFGMALGGEGLARLMSFAASPLALLLAGAGSERLRPGTGRIGAAVVALSPLFTGFTGYQYLELSVLLYVAAAFLAFHRYRAEGERAWVVLAAMLTGFALGVKITAFPILVFLLPLVLAAVRREGVRAGLLIAAGILAFSIPAGFWPVWNWTTTGSFVPGYLQLAIQDEIVHAGPDESRWKGQFFVALGSIVTTSEYWIDSAGPFVIAAIGGALLFRKPAESRLPALLVVGAVGFYMFVLAVRLRSYLWVDSHARYLGPCLLGFGAAAAAPFLGWMQRGPKAVRTALIAALLLPGLPLLALKAGKAAVAAPAAFGLESRSHYLAKKIETYEACEILNNLPDPDVRVHFLAHRPYYLDRPLAPNDFWQGVRGKEDYVQRLRETGVTHVVYEPGSVAMSWLKDPDAVFGARPFVELRRWPWKQQGWVRLYAVEKR
jgi:hypothetical protein